MTEVATLVDSLRALQRQSGDREWMSRPMLTTF